MLNRPSKAQRVATLTFLNIWIVIGAIVLISVGFSVIGALSSVLLFLGVGAVSAFIASPIVNFLERHKVPRGIGALLGLIIVIVAVVLLLVLVIPMVTGQLVELLRDAPSKISALSTWVVQLEKDFSIIEHVNNVVQIDSLIETAQEMINGVLTSLLSAIRDGIVPLVNNIASTVFTVFLGFVLGYWLANDYPKINDEICRVLPDSKEDDYRLMIAVVSRSVGGYLRAMLINSIIQGFLAYIGFSIVGHPYAATMGLLSGILNIIPVVGPSISCIIAVLIALFYSPVMAFWTLIVAMLSQNITDNVIAPKINQSTMSVHPVISLTALVLGSTFGGAIGMVVALPLAAVIKSLFIFYYETRTGAQIVSYEGALFRGAPFRDADGNPVPAFDALGDDSFVADSQILDDDLVPDAVSVPKPKSDFDNPWAKIMSFDNPFTTHASTTAKENSVKTEESKAENSSNTEQ